MSKISAIPLPNTVPKQEPQSLESLIERVTLLEKRNQSLEKQIKQNKTKTRKSKSNNDVPKDETENKKRELNAYQLFMKEEMARLKPLKLANPDLKQADLVKMVGLKWREIKGQSNPGQEIKPKPKTTKKNTDDGDKNKKRKPTVYNNFMGTEIARLKLENPDLNHQQAFTLAVKNWADSPLNKKSSANQATTTANTEQQAS